MWKPLKCVLQSDSVSNVQTANPVKVETDMGDESGSVENVKTK